MARRVPFMKVQLVTIKLPHYGAILSRIIRDFMPIAGKRIRTRAWDKIGVYQPASAGTPAWPKLAASTLRRKRRSLKRMGQRAPWMRATGGGADQPLIDTGKMGNSIDFRVARNTAFVFADFPMHVHEQDTLVAPFTVPPNALPRRAVLWPALEESIPPLIDELEAFVALRL